MENSLRVLINFDKKITKNQLEKYFHYSWKKKSSTQLKYFLFIILFLIIMDSFLKPERSRADFLVFLGLFLLITSILYFITYFFNKANYISKLNKHIEDLKKNNPVTELYFDETSFYIISEQYDIRSIWKNVFYEISKETIYITIEIGSPFTFIVDKNETNQYQEILDFLKSKSKSKK